MKIDGKEKEKAKVEGSVWKEKLPEENRNKMSRDESDKKEDEEKED